jgi:hypothetical protein
MTLPERPRLRGTITGHVDPDNAALVWLYDGARIARDQIRVRREVVGILELFNGQHTLRDIQVLLMRRQGGMIFPLEALHHLASQLDELLFLEGSRFQDRIAAFLRSPVREPSCIGSYEEDPRALREQLREQFHRPGGPGGLPAAQAADGRLRGALIPHIDYQRGGHTYAWGFKEVIERSDADVFVIIGTSHYSRHRYILTEKDFRTPLGVAVTDKEYVARIAAGYGANAFADEAAHLPEHSIELHVVFLQYLLEGRRPFQVVPLLVGPFQDCIDERLPPQEREDIDLMIRTLRQAEQAAGAKVCYLSSGDLAHIGPKFSDLQPVDQPQLDQSKRQDHALLQCLSAASRDRFFAVLEQEADARRICGFPPTFTLLSVLEPESGRLLHYDQYVAPNGFESVSFASVGFYR